MKNQLKKDIRHLGKLLGKVIAEQEGDEVYRQVEAARALSFDIARGTSDISALVDLFRNNTTRDFLPIARAFNHFALLANLVEDLHDNANYIADREAGLPAPDSTLEATAAKLSAAKAEISPDNITQLLKNAQVAPVLTAHPTETRRRTVFDAQEHITALLVDRHRILNAPENALTKTRLDNIDQQITRWLTTLWQTALIRVARPRIEDEIEVGLRYYKLSLLKAIPDINQTVTPPASFGPRELHSHDTATPAPCAPTPMCLAHLDDQQSDNARQSRHSPALRASGRWAFPPCAWCAFRPPEPSDPGKTDRGRAQRGYHEVAD